MVLLFLVCGIKITPVWYRLKWKNQGMNGKNQGKPYK